MNSSPTTIQLAKMHPLVIIFALLQTVLSCSEDTFGNTTIRVSYDEEHGSGHPVDISKCIESNRDTENSIWLWTTMGSSYNVLRKGAVQNLTKLRFLRLRVNGIESIEPGAFVNLPIIENIVLITNNLTEVKTGVFDGLQLINLWFEHNQIQTVEEGAFDNMPRLTVLDFDDNKLTEWSPRFTNTTNLKWLYLAKNSFKIIPERAFSNLDNLRGLNLTNNAIETIHPNAFEGLTSLQELDISKNLLKEFLANVFTPIRNLKYLHFNGNKFAYLSNRTLAEIAEVKAATVHSNPWQCGCLENIQHWAGKEINLNQYYTACVIESNRKCLNLHKGVIECDQAFDEDFYEKFYLGYQLPPEDCSI